MQGADHHSRSSLFSGIDQNKIKLFAYVFCGFCSGIAGIIGTSNISTSDATSLGLNLELDAILAGMWIGRGLSYFISNDSIAINNRIYAILARTKILIPGLSDVVAQKGNYVTPSVVIGMIILALAIYIAHYTRFGRTIYSLGGNNGANEQSARLMGLPVNRTKILVYTLNGFCSALAGILLSIYTGSGHGAYGNTMEMTMIAAVVIGGTALTGGEGYVFGAVFGVLITILIQTMIQIQGTLISWWTLIMVGLITLFFIGLQSLIANLRIGQAARHKVRGRLNRRQWVYGGIAAAVILLEEASVESKGWGGMVTGISQSAAGDLHIDLAIANHTQDWSAMQANEGRPVVLTTAEGKTANCDTVFIGTGGNSLAPGFQMRGYTTGPKKAPATQLLYVECKGVSAGTKLSIGYHYVTGAYDLHVPSVPVNATLALDLTQVANDVQYPVAPENAGVIEKPGDKIAAINNFTLSLVDARRTETGLELDWQDYNPTDYPNYVHIGIPLVIGADGIIYGVYEDPSIADATITLSKQTAEWKTTVAVPQAVTGLYVLVGVETRQSKYFVSHVIDISDK